jgi:RsiW-degrading membrane proteinase PrsW (M82 family)
MGIGYMRLVLGPKGEESTGFWHLKDIIYDLALYQVGLRIGGIIALLFILVDGFYLRKKLKSNSKGILIRFLVLIVIAFVVVSTHYICEKVIDII